MSFGGTCFIGELCMGVGRAAQTPKALLLNLCALAIVLASGLIMWALIAGGHDWGSDFASYIMQAKSIVAGNPADFVSRNRFTICNTAVGLGPVAYPWGLPLLLAPVYAAFGIDLAAMKTVMLASYAGFLATLWFGFKTHSAPWRLVLLCFFAFHPMMLSLVNLIMSDLPFLLFSTLAMVLIGAVIVDRRPILAPTADHVLVGLAMAAAFLMRSNGILLLAALAGAQLPRAVKRRLSALDLVPYAAFLAAVLAEHAVLPGGGDIGLNAGPVITTMTWPRIYDNLFHNVGLIRDVLDTTLPALPLTAALPFALAVIGAVATVRRSYHWLIYMGLTFLLFTIWPWRQGVRFLLPILPFYLSFIVTGLECIAERLARKTGFRLIAVGVLVVAAAWDARQAHLSIGGAAANVALGRPAPDGPFTDEAQRLFAFLRDNTRADEVVIFRKPRVVALMTGRLAYRTRNPAEFAKGNVLVIDRKFDEGWFNLLPASERDRLVKIQDGERFEIFRLPPAQPDAQAIGSRC